MKLIVAANISEDIKRKLKKENFQLIYTFKNTNLLPGLEYHADMQIAKVCGKYICDKSLISFYKEALGDSADSLVCGDFVCSSNYPKDIAYNIKVLGNNIIHNFKHTDSCVKKIASGMTQIDVAQGYSGCSICSVGDNALITADSVIAKKALSRGIDVLLISPGHISLPGFDYGFIGGASFFCKNTLYFFGDATCHPDWKKIYSFCSNQNVNILNLSDEPLCDYGSAITVD